MPTPIAIDAEYARMLGIPNLNAPQPPADRRAAMMGRFVMEQNYPASWSADRWTQAAQYEGVPYVAIKAIGTWLGCGTPSVKTKRNEPNDGPDEAVVKKSLDALGGKEDYEPVSHDHDLAKLMRRPNSQDTFGRFIKKWNIYNKLTGNVLTWAPHNQLGMPDPALGMWILPSQKVQYIPPGPSYPAGGWRLMPGYGQWGGVGIPYAGNIPIDAREVLWYREPGAINEWDGYSPVQGVSRYIDSLNGIDKSRKNAMDYGVNPDAIVSIEGATGQQLADLHSRFQEQHGGADNARKVLFIDGQAVDVDLLSRAVKDMDYQAGWEQVVKPILAAIGVPPLVAGLVEQGNYAAFFAALRQFFAAELRPMAHDIGEFLTVNLAAEYWGDEYCIQIDLPDIEDPEEKKALLALQPGPLYTFNEARAVLKLPPVEGGDVPADVYSQVKAAELMPKPVPVDQFGNDLERRPGEPSKNGKGRQDGSDGGAPQPDNPASGGSLANRMTKSIANGMDTLAGQLSVLLGRN